MDGLPALMEELESEQKTIEAQLADGAIFTNQPDLGVQLTTRLAQIEDELMTALARWEELDGR